MGLRITAALATVALLTACGGDDANTTTPTTTASRSSESTAPTATTFPGFTLQSPTFEDGSPIPEVHTCEGENRSQDLSWGEPPAGTQSFALVLDDPDAPGGSFTHLLLYDILADSRSLFEEQDGDGPYPAAYLGLNDNNGLAYSGPCPPRGQTHHYVFTLYALDSRIGREAGAERDEIMAAIEGHVLAEATLTGTFER